MVSHFYKSLLIKISGKTKQAECGLSFVALILSSGKLCLILYSNFSENIYIVKNRFRINYFLTCVFNYIKSMRSRTGSNHHL